MMKYLSWKTTASGLGAILFVFFTMIWQPLMDDDPATSPDYNKAIPLILAGLGLVSARDNDKTSEEVGAKVGEKPRPAGE